MKLEDLTITEIVTLFCGVSSKIVKTDEKGRLNSSSDNGNKTFNYLECVVDGKKVVIMIEKGE